MISITSKSRFDDVGPADADGFVEYAYHGYNYNVMAQDRSFTIRTYDHEPGVATIIQPTDARKHKETPAVIKFLVNSLGCTKIGLYDGRSGTYSTFDIEIFESENICSDPPSE